jgi:hypothetical protein
MTTDPGVSFPSTENVSAYMIGSRSVDGSVGRDNGPGRIKKTFLIIFILGIVFYI